MVTGYAFSALDKLLGRLAGTVSPDGVLRDGYRFMGSFMRILDMDLKYGDHLIIRLISLILQRMEVIVSYVVFIVFTRGNGALYDWIS